MVELNFGRVSLAWRIALTFLRKRNSYLPSFTATFSCLGVAFGVSAFLVVVTIFQSFELELKKLLTSANPQLVVYSFPAGIAHPSRVMEKIKDLLPSPAQDMSPFEYAEAMVGKQGSTAAVVVRGIPGTRAASAPALEHVISPIHALKTLNETHISIPKQGSKVTLKSPISVIIGKSLAKKLGAHLNDEILLSSSGFGLVGEATVRTLRVTGFMEIGLSQYDERLLLMPLGAAQQIFGRPGFSKGIEIRFKNIDEALVASRKLQSEDSLPYTIRAVQELDSGLFQQVERDGAAIKMIVLVITLVASFNIIATLYLGVVDRYKAIGILRSLGASRKFIVFIFILLGTFLGTTGGILGVIIGSLLLKIFSGLELGELQTFYFVPKVPVFWDFKLFSAALAVAIFLSFLSALFPAWRASLITPIHAIKRN